MNLFARSGSVVSSDVSTVRAVELDCSAPVLTECIIGHVVLLGDSIFDNFRFVPCEPTVIDQLRKELPPGWCAFLLAVDGHVTADVPAQVANLPGDATHLVVSTWQRRLFCQAGGESNCPQDGQVPSICSGSTLGDGHEALGRTVRGFQEGY